MKDDETRDWIQLEKEDIDIQVDVVTLKRMYFKLQDDEKFRRRIDTAVCKWKLFN
jgi:hypothetical protein